MDIMELGAIGELVGGVAVIASLIYVGLQVRQNTSATRAASHHAVTDSFNEINISLGRYPELARVWSKGNESRASLTSEECVQYDMTWLSYLRIFETLFYQSGVGTAEYQLLISEQRSLRAMFANPGGREWWAANPYAFSEEFRSYAESFFPSPAPSEGV